VHRSAPASKSLDLLFLKRAQEFRLQFDWQISDLVEKQRASVSGLKSADALRHGARKGASLVTE
jgi:hypothetical protein